MYWNKDSLYRQEMKSEIKQRENKQDSWKSVQIYCVLGNGISILRQKGGSAIQKLRVDVYIARKYSCFHHCEKDCQEVRKYISAKFAFKYTEEPFTGFVFRLLLYPCFRETGICMQ